MKAIEARDLVKRFEDVEAVKGINLTIEEGELFGLLGPNGAGKTTTISMLCTIQKPSGGSATIYDHDVVKEPDTVRRLIGIVFQDPSLDDNLTGRENLDFHARLYKVPRGEIAQRINDVLELVELSDKADVIVKKYSGGMKRRLEIARGLLHHPRVLFLDEPTLGLDPQTRRHIWDYIEKLNREKNITMILTTHYMDEADKLCDRIAIVDHGRLVALDSPLSLKAGIPGRNVVEVSFSGAPPDWRQRLERLPAVDSLSGEGSVFRIASSSGPVTTTALIAAAAEADVAVRSLAVHSTTLDDVFVHFTGRDLRDALQEPSAADQRMLMRR